MDLASFGLFLLASGAVALAPGPSTLLVLSHALGRDARRPASLIAGAFFGNLLLVLVTVSGISALLLASQTAFELLRWVGAGYLIYLGLRTWFAPVELLQTGAVSDSAAYRALFVQAFLTSVTNPKGLVFYLAFLPLFVSPGWPVQLQLVILGGAYVLIFMAALALYALAGRRVARFFTSARVLRLKNRVTGGLLILAGLSLLRYQRP